MRRIVDTAMQREEGIADERAAEQARRLYYDRLRANAARAALLGDGGVSAALDELRDALVPCAKQLAQTIRDQGTAHDGQIEQATKLAQALKQLAAARTAHDPAAEDPELAKLRDEVAAARKGDG